MPYLSHLFSPTVETSCIKRLSESALVGVGQWIERQPVSQRVAGLIPGCGTCLGCGPGQVPSRGCVTGNHTFRCLSISPSLLHFSLPLCLKYINKIFKKTKQNSTEASQQSRETIPFSWCHTRSKPKSFLKIIQ